jgi:Fe-S-cluster containining protein
MVGNYAEYIDEMKRGCKDFTNNGKCSNCGGCCSRLLWLSTKEIQTIREYIAKHKIQTVKRLLPVNNPIMDLQCPFRDDEHRKCLIYPVRPRICKYFKCSNVKRGATKKEMETWSKSDSRPCDMRELFG